MVSQRPMAPLPRAGVEAALRPFGESTLLPPAAYVSDEVFSWEQRHFFEGGWCCVGLASSIPHPLDQRAETVGRGGVFLTRGKDGVLRAFANTCRHRGHELLACGAETVNRPIVLCPYHGWSYRLDGTLRKAPGFGPESGLDLEAHHLVELACEEWHGLVFVDPSGEAGAFAEHVEGLEAVLSPYELGRLVPRGQHRYVVSANWKIMCENYEECYHCPVIHPQLCAASPPKSGEDHSGHRGAWVGGYMEVRDGFATMSLDPERSSPPLRGLDEHRRRIVDYLCIFPNLLVSLHPDYVMTHVLTPLGPSSTGVVCEWHFAPEAAESEDFDPSYAIDFWDVTNRQDWSACESVQRGLSSPRALAGPLSWEEGGVYGFVTMVANGYLGRAPRPAPLNGEGGSPLTRGGEAPAFAAERR